MMRSRILKIVKHSFLDRKIKAQLIGVCILLSACHKPVFKERWIKQKAPEQFVARINSSKGNIDVEFIRKWSPLAVDRLYAQIKHHYYDHTLFYRVRPKYVAQFGGDDSLKMTAWGRFVVVDEPVVTANDRGIVSFARDGKNSRGNDIFINLKNNSPRLDTVNASGVKGYPPVGKVIRGMEIVDTLYNGYGDKIFDKYNELLHRKNEFQTSYPRLDSIQTIRLVKGKKK